MEPKFPNITVRLVGNDGNAFAVLGLVSKALKKANVPKDEISRFTDEAIQGDYDHLLRTVMQWVNVE